MKKSKYILLLVVLVLLLTGCEEIDTTTTATTNKKGRCLEYKTEYKLDCGFFVDHDSFCKERKYDVCVRWEEENNENS